MADFYPLDQVDGDTPKRSTLETDGCGFCPDFQSPKHQLVARGATEICDSGVSMSYVGECAPSLGPCEYTKPCANDQTPYSPCVSVGYTSVTGPEDIAVDSALEGQMQGLCIAPAVPVTTTTSCVQLTPCPVQQPVDPRRAFIERLQLYYTPDEDGDTKLHLAVISKDIDAVFYLVLAAASCASSLLDFQNYEFRQTALHLAVLTDQPAAVRLLVNAGASRDVRDRNGNTPLHLACKRGYVRCFVEMMHEFTAAEHAQVAQYCLNAGLPEFKPPTFHLPNVNALDYEGLSCLHLVDLWKTHPQLARDRVQALHILLHSCGANVNIQEGKSGHSLLHLAVKQCDTELFTYLLQVPSLDVNLLTYSRLTALDIGAMLGHKDMVRQLKAAAGTHSDIYQSDSSSSDSDEMDSYDDLVIGGHRRSLNSLH